MSKKDILAKMLAKAEDAATTPAEAANIMAKAMKLAEKHGLTLDDIRAGNVSKDEFGARSYFSGERYLHPSDNLLAAAVGRFCGCEVYRERKEDGHYIQVFGHESDVELMFYLLRLFRNTLDNGWTIFRDYGINNPREVKAARQTYCGAYAIRERLKAYHEQRVESTGTELVEVKSALVAQHFQQYCEANDLNLGHGKAGRASGGYHAGAAGAGTAAGKAVDIGRGVNSGGYVAIGK